MFALTLACIAIFVGADAAPGPYIPIDMSAVVNTDPLGLESPFIPGTTPRVPDWQWFEAEDCYRKSDGVAVVQQTRASAGKMLGGQWGAKPGDWAEWNFDLPWQSENLQLYLRIARHEGNPVAKLNLTWDGESSWSVQVPHTGGPGDNDTDYEGGLARVELGRQQMGRHILRITSESENDKFHIDGFWLCDGEIDVVNRIGNDGRIKPAASQHNLLFPPGQRRIRGIDFVLIDRDQNEGKGFFLSGDAPLVLDGGSERAATLHLLGAGIRITPAQQVDPNPSSATAEILYEDGSKADAPLLFNPLYSSKQGDAVVTLGLRRFGYLIDIPLDPAKPLREVRIRPGEGRFLVIAATLELPKAP